MGIYRPAILITGVLILCSPACGVDGLEPDRTIIYKTEVSRPLGLHVFSPDGISANSRLPAVVFFHGGGWKIGSPRRFYRQAKAIAALGLVAISVDYRIESKDGTEPIDAVRDGAEALRWIRSNSDSLGIDPQKIVVSGGSAGGQIAAALATLDNLGGEPVDYRPNFLVLFNPVIDNGPSGYGYRRVSPYWREFSPMHNINQIMPPTLILSGEVDHVAPVDSHVSFCERARTFLSECAVIMYGDQAHGFFKKKPCYSETLAALVNFLVGHGLVKRDRIGFTWPMSASNCEIVERWPGE